VFDKPSNAMILRRRKKSKIGPICGFWIWNMGERKWNV